MTTSKQLGVRQGVRVASGVALAGLLTWALAGTALAAQRSVAISGFAFAPSTLTVTVGGTVTPTNQDGVGHTATAPGAFDTGTIASGQSMTVTMTRAGAYTYHCQIHPSMTGRIVVQAAVAAPSGATAEPLPPTDAVLPPSHSDGYGWLILIAAVGSGVATLLQPVRRQLPRRRR